MFERREPLSLRYMHRCWNGRQASFRNWCPTGMRVRVPLCAPYTFLAQLVEQRSFKPQVAGSSPAGRTTCVLSSVGNHRFALPGAGEAKRGFPQRSKNARISESPKHFSGTARRRSGRLKICASQVRFLESPPYGRMPESGQKERTVNPLASAYVGSNPTSPTIRKTLTTGERNFVEQQSPGPLRI